MPPNQMRAGLGMGSIQQENDERGGQRHDAGDKDQRVGIGHFRPLIAAAMAETPMATPCTPKNESRIVPW